MAEVMSERGPRFGEASFTFKRLWLGWSVRMEVEAAPMKPGYYLGKVTDHTYGLTRKGAERRAERCVSRLRRGKAFVF